MQCRVKKLAQRFHTAAHDSNVGSLSQEFEALPTVPLLSTFEIIHTYCIDYADPVTLVLSHSLTYLNK